jgi:hypothetical protein
MEPIYCWTDITPTYDDHYDRPTSYCNINTGHTTNRHDNNTCNSNSNDNSVDNNFCI